MFVFRSLLAFIAFGIVAALPHGSHPNVFHHRRQVRVPTVKGRTCKPGNSGNGTSIVPVPSATPSAVSQHLNAHPSSSAEHSSSSVKTSSNVVKTATSSASSAAASATQPASITPHSSFAALAPLSFKQSWSTAPSSGDALPLSDATFRPTNVLSGLPWKYGPGPDGKPAIVVNYPKDSYNFQHEPRGGVSFYAPGPSSVDVTKAKELVFGYTAIFEDGFDFVKGGKMPGIYGGNSASEATSCSGGRRSDECFSVRLMWRGEGAAEAYTYLPPSFSANKKVCDIPPFSECNPTYGASVGRGAFNFNPGEPLSVAIRVRLNDAGAQNGEFEVFANGKSVVSADGLVLRNGAQGLIRGIMAQSFFGGSTPDFASTKDQTAYFRDFTVSVNEYL